jgi:hypothetical protein
MNEKERERESVGRGKGSSLLGLGLVIGGVGVHRLWKIYGPSDLTLSGRLWLHAG